MNLFRQIVGRSAVLIVGIAVVSGAQERAGQGDLGDAHRWGLGLSVDAGTLPPALARDCSDGTSVGSVGGGVAAFFRPRGVLMFEGDVRGSLTWPCSDRVFLPPPGLSSYSGSTTYSSSLPQAPLLRSVLRVGVETPRQFPLVRLTAGGGIIATHGTAFFETAAIGVGTRSEGMRVFAELETNVTRTRARTVYTTVTQSGSTYTTNGREVSEIVHPQWTTLHLGMEFPLNAKR